MAISRYERTLPILDVGKRSEAVVLQLEVPIGVIEGLSSLLSWHCALVKVAGESLSSIRASRAGNLDGEGKAKIVDEQMDEGRKRLGGRAPHSRAGTSRPRNGQGGYPQLCRQRPCHRHPAFLGCGSARLSDRSFVWDLTEVSIVGWAEWQVKHTGSTSRANSVSLY
jgi:hypothetical protein